MPFAEARARATDEGRWLVVHATIRDANERMDQLTWRDEEVVRWFDEKGLAIQIDVEADAELAKALELREAPRLIAFQAGEEKERVLGFRDAKRLLEWLRGLERGETALDRARQAVTDPAHDMRGRFRLARALRRAGRMDEATEELVWLWHNMVRVRPSMRGVRVSFMAGEMEDLAATHAPARERFARIRDELEPAPDGEGRFDWIVLNSLLRENERTLSWFDAVKDDAGSAPTLEHCAHRLVDILKEGRRWADIGRLYRDPLAELTRAHELSKPPPLPERDAAQLAMIAETFQRAFLDRAGLLVGCLQAAGRDAEAEAVRREALRLDPSDEMKHAVARRFD